MKRLADAGDDMSNLCFTILAVLVMAAVLIIVQLDVLSAVDG